jgi:hypothetical protein
MSKRFKGKTCAYCAGIGISETGDHIFAREFIPVEHRAELPQVPACRGCNGVKSKLEHYLATVMPLGGRHPLSAQISMQRVTRRLEANQRLHRDLRDGRLDAWHTERGKTYLTSALPFEGEKLERLFAMITKGLTLFHFDQVLPVDWAVGAGFLTRKAEGMHEDWLIKPGMNRVTGSIGAGLFEYEGVQGASEPCFTIWRHRIYGGLMLANKDRPGERPETIWATSTRLASQSILTR